MKKIKTSTIKDLIENIGISAKYKQNEFKRFELILLVPPNLGNKIFGIIF